jgi:hypothetical protein
MPKKRTLAVAAGVVLSFAGLGATIIFLSRAKMVSVEMAILMLAALLGLYVGFGVLIVAYRLIGKLK